MARGRWNGVEHFYRAAERFVDQCLRREGSLFTPGRPIWSSTFAGEIAPPMLEHQLGSDSLAEKLRNQLAGLSESGKQLIAELVYVQLLPIADQTGSAKRARLEQVLGQLADRVSVPDDLDAALDYGLASYGAARTRAPDQMRFLVRFAHAWTAEQSEERARMLGDPWQFKGWLARIDPTGAQTQFEALLHIVHPEVFENVVSKDVKERIAEAYRGASDGSDDVDEALLAIRRKLEPVLGRDFSFYEQSAKALWDEAGETARWNEFLQWAARLYREPDFDAQERDYKIEIAEHMGAARASLDDADWLSELRRAFGPPNNLTHWQFEHNPLLEWAEREPDAARAFLREIWFGDHESALRGALNALPASVISGRAARASLASLLLFGVDETEFPFFRHQVYAETCRLVGRDVVGKEASVGDLYSDWRALLDELRVRLLARGVELRDQLDAQSLAWWVVQGPIPEDWSDADKAAFLDFRAGGGDDDARERAWLVRGANNQSVDREGVNMLPVWFREGFISIGWPNARPIRADADLAEIRERLREAVPDAPEGEIVRGSGIQRRFLDIQPDDWVVTPDGDRLYIARVTGESFWHADDPSSALRRPVRWLNTESPASRATVEQTAPDLYRSLKTLLTVSDLTDHLEAIRALVDRDDRIVDEGPPRVTIAPPGDRLARRLFLSRDWVRETVDLLNSKGQVIFYGPPGTGKTYVAQAVGEHVAESGGTWRLVQFHPAYSYEDFFEGYRPEQRIEGGALSFRLRHGPLREMVDVARRAPDVPHLLVIDEINRGNIAKIFGELYFLLEYRDRAVRLQYSPDDDFSLPSNLFFIGTMNTADRSIALVDSALRRRFYFVPFLPREAPVRDVLRLWLRENGLSEEPAQVLDELNRLLGERGDGGDEFAIGPSYFMTPEASRSLERVWAHAILPLLEERFYGGLDREEVVAQFGLAAVRRHLTRADEREEVDTTPAPDEAA